MKSSWWTSLVLSIVIISTGSVAAFNIYIDPLWMFGFSHENNDVQTTINEREQKVNRMVYQPFSYDALLLGSSRATYINQHDLAGDDVYNFAVSDMSFLEYKSFLQVAVEENGRHFDRVYIGVDFFKTSKQESKLVGDMVAYAEEIRNPIYRWKQQVSLDVLDYARTNYRASTRDEDVFVRNYTRDNVATAWKLSEEQVARDTEAKVSRFRETFYGDSYEYNPEYAEVMKELVELYPDTEFVIFTTPVAEPLLRAMAEEGRLPDYERWITELVEVFGGVHNFMTLNEVTRNWKQNYFDGHHAYEHVGTWIAQRMSDANASAVPQDFGLIVTEENLEQHLQSVENSLN
ncbi:hypothetical protein [Mangrovibacillus cuniculi]|uniref:Uncharacterized protein n=1 Tax=Mangrovibacillus cuniculi TaxID=2593652 RepID=A0A7S8CCP2_9BACI|nr:hypothetical protein [Mangrovibacillus cuniculi]QPC47544.1 hypothetical protein G8O30_11580 [Mangrovibacillus cuniculi]